MVKTLSEQAETLSGHQNSPLEAMAKAHWDHGASAAKWDDLEEFVSNAAEVRSRQVEEMRAALLALAECELPREVIAFGQNEMCHDGIRPSPIFRAMLRAIAADKVS